MRRDGEIQLDFAPLCFHLNMNLNFVGTQFMERIKHLEKNMLIGHRKIEKRDGKINTDLLDELEKDTFLINF